MSSANFALNGGATRKSYGLISLLLLYSFSAILLAPSATAVSGDYEITTSLSPLPGEYVEPFEDLEISVRISNTGFFVNQDGRSIEWWICEEAESNCKGSAEQYGASTIDPIAIGQSVDFVFPISFNPNSNYDGAFKIIYEFSEADTGNSSNDYYETIFYFTSELVDVSIDVQNPTDQISGLAIYDGEKIFNTNTDYQMDISGIVNSCGSCELDAHLGWRLYNSTGDEVASDFTSVTDLPAWGESSFTRTMPPMSYSEEGNYTFEFGLLNSSGSSYGDLNDYNDLQSVQIIFDDSVDLQISQLYPLNAPSSSTYFYGNDSVGVIVKNLGNMTVKQPLIRFTVMDLTDEIESEEDCYPEEILPGEIYYCIFDLTVLGDKNLKVMASEMLNEGQDYRPSDNTITQTSEVIAGEISPQIEQSNFNGEYNTGDTITFNARTSSLAASPLTYTWLQAGIISLGDEKELNISGSFLGLGDHYISVRVTDALGAIDSHTILVTVFNSTIIDSGNWLTGTAVTRTHAKGEAEYQLPVAGFNYGSGENSDALMIMSVEVSSTDGSSDPGMDWMEFDINLTEILPENIPRESISVNQLFGMDQINWAPLEDENYFTLIDNNTMRIHIESNMDLIFIGDLPEPNITAGQPEITLLPDGAMRINWEPQGDLQNQYFGGWKIYRMTGIPNGTTYFPDPAVYTNVFEWNSLLEFSLVDYVPAETNAWTDSNKLETGTCVSYAIIPANRAGTPSPLSGYVTRVNGEPGLTCGDAIDPLREVTSFTSSVVYNNDTACYNSSGDVKGNFKTWDACYELTLSWEWPNDELEGNISWNLYRIELKPNDVDLRFVEPIATNIDNIPGEKAYFYQNGTDDCPTNCDNGIRPYRTYYYILTPIDHIGNELTIIDYPSSNIERVNIQSEHWNYNSYRVPEPEPEPEPPMGVDWFGDLQENVETESFQIAGMVMISILIMNLIGLPLILKRRKKLKRVISKRISKAPAEFDENEFDDFFN